MSYIYRYELKDKKDKKNIDLYIFKDEIQDVICDIFKKYELVKIEESILYVNKESNYFEFRTKKKIQNKNIRSMGKKLKGIKGLESICGFKRSSIDYIASINKVTNEYMEFDLIEYNDLQRLFRNYNRLKKQASQMKNEEIICEIVGELDIFLLTVSNDLINLKNIKENEEMHKKHYIMTAINIQKESDRCILERDFKENYYINDEYEPSDIPNKRGSNESIKIINIKQNDEIDLENEINEIFNIKNFNIKNFSEDKIQNRIKNISELRIINVGQGLSNALSDSKGNPMLYLDFGSGCRRNKCTMPYNLNFNLQEEPIIVLSHIHEDHWAGVRRCKDALNMRWIIPNQDIGNKKQIFKLYSELHKKRNLYYINDEICLKNVNIDISEFVIFKGNGNDKHVHNNSNNIYIKLIDGKQILLCADTRYEYIDKKYKNNINILCASHHGGQYNEQGSDIYSIPTCDICNKIVYSYGKNYKFKPYYNSFKHPSKKADYIERGWKNEHDTPDGDYVYKFGNCIN